MEKWSFISPFSLNQVTLCQWYNKAEGTSGKTFSKQRPKQELVQITHEHEILFRKENHNKNQPQMKKHTTNSESDEKTVKYYHADPEHQCHRQHHCAWNPMSLTWLVVSYWSTSSILRPKANFWLAQLAASSGKLQKASSLESQSLQMALWVDHSTKAFTASIWSFNKFSEIQFVTPTKLWILPEPIFHCFLHLPRHPHLHQHSLDMQFQHHFHWALQCVHSTELA